MKTKQAVNPYLPSWEYVPDAEPHICLLYTSCSGSSERMSGKW